MGGRNRMNYSKKWNYYLTEEPKTVLLLLEANHGNTAEPL